MKTKVNLTLKDLINGKQCVSNCCPIALALERELKDTCEISIGVADVEIWDWNNKEEGDIEGDIIPLPGEAIEFIITFDGRETRDKAEPISFDIDIPEKYLKQSV